MNLFLDGDILEYVEIDDLENKLIKHYRGRFGKFTKEINLPASDIKEIKERIIKE